MPFKITSSVPDGTYRGTLESVEEERGQYGQMRKWHWLLDVNGELTPYTQFTPATTGTGTVSYKQLTVLLGRAPQSGEVIEDPTGVTVLVTIKANDKGTPKVESLAPYVAPQTTVDGVPR